MRVVELAQLLEADIRWYKEELTELARKGTTLTWTKGESDVQDYLWYVAHLDQALDTLNSMQNLGLINDGE